MACCWQILAHAHGWIVSTDGHKLAPVVGCMLGPIVSYMTDLIVGYILRVDLGYMIDLIVGYIPGPVVRYMLELEVGYILELVVDYMLKPMARYTLIHRKVLRILHLEGWEIRLVLNDCPDICSDLSRFDVCSESPNCLGEDRILGCPG